MVFVQVALDRLDSRGSKVADYLLVIDMQSDYVAVGKAYHEELIVAVNDKIASYPATGLSIFSIAFFLGEKKIERRNLRPACCLYLLVSLRSVGLLALLIQI